MASQPLAALTYTLPEKKVGWIEQTISVTIGTLSLFEHEIVTLHHAFPISTVHDCSYKPFSDGSCLFYLHTDQGVRTYHVKADPAPFLTAYRRLRGDVM